MPRSLYGRAALILILPVLTLQIVVSFVFIQRHFEGVTRQMSSGVVLELRLIEGIIQSSSSIDNAIQSLDELGQSLRFSVKPVASVPVDDERRFWDVTGIWVTRTLKESLPNLEAVLLPNDFLVFTYLPSKFGPVEVSFNRFSVSPANAHQLIVWTIGLGIVMVLIAYAFLRNQLRPIKRLSYAAEAFGKGRHLPYRPTGAAEVRSAGNAFLEMRARIERYIEQRTLILSGVSHDLRTPLTRLKLALSMSDDPSAVDMKKDVEDMQRLLDEFLTFARGDAEAAVEIEKVDPVQLVTEIVSDESTRGVPVTLIAASGQGQVELRPVAVRRAIINLIGNAVHYGNRAEVSLLVNDHAMTVTVEDDGPGIAEDMRDEALKPFARLDPARNQNFKTGVGLGLPIAVDVARAHGGSIKLGKSSRLGGLKAELIIAR